MKYFNCLLLLLCISCAEKKVISDKFEKRKKLGKVVDMRIDEASGIAASRTNPGKLWTHNDSGNTAEVFLVDGNLEVLLTLSFPGIKNRDWEDITIGPGPEPGKNYLYIAEIGDNLHQYQYKHVYRFEEPVYIPGRDKIVITAFDDIIFQLPGRRKDTEALLIDPASKNLYVITKHELPVHIYEIKYPYHPGDTTTATDVGTLHEQQIVSGSISPDGSEVLIKGYRFVLYWKNSSNKRISDLLMEKPERLDYQEEPQGESVAWAADGSGYFTLSEKKITQDSFLYFYKRK